MPYHTKAVKGGVKNINKKTGKATSKKPMTRENAEKQKKVIAMKEKAKDMKKGKGKSKDSMEDRLKEHSNHHSKKHMDMMRKDIKAGMSFSMAHKKAQKAVGK